jgi:hypothetical protein
MFATLAIQLPSEHEGGSLIVRHNGEEVHHDFGGSDARFGTFYAAHYTDLEHSLTPIKAGYRFALTYSLCWDRIGPAPSLVEGSADASQLHALLQSWPPQTNHTPIGIILEHQYTENSLKDGVQALKTERA